MARGPQWPQLSRSQWSGAGALLTVSLGHFGLAVPVDENGHWAAPIWPAATWGLRQLPEPPGAPTLALSPGCTGASRDKASAGWCGGLEGSQDLSPGALGTAVQYEVFAGTGRNSRLSLGLVLLLLIFLNCR